MGIPTPYGPSFVVFQATDAVPERLHPRSQTETDRMRLRMFCFYVCSGCILCRLKPSAMRSRSYEREGEGVPWNIAFQETPRQEEPGSSERDVPLETDALFA